VIAVFTFGPLEDNKIRLLIGIPLSARASNTGKYRTQTKYRKVQDSYKNTGIYRTTGITAKILFYAIIYQSHKWHSEHWYFRTQILPVSR